MNYKRVLIVDDTEIDREILRNILKNDFDVMEASNGYTGLETILSGKHHLDAVLLDISMPIINGFDILKHMKDNNITDLPVLLITAEATKDNVKRAAEYNVSGFISKPFEPEFVLDRLGSILDVETSEVLYSGTITSGNLADISSYEAKLKTLYLNYLKNNNKNDDKCIIVSDLMKIVLREYAAVTSDNLDLANIDVISQAAYFYNIGKMAVPDKLLLDDSHDDYINKNIYQSHTTIGAGIINLNEVTSCRYFVQVCGDMCMHHHERFDGKGFPHNLKGEEISPYTRLCRIIIDFHEVFSRKKAFNYLQFQAAINEMKADIGAYDPALLEIFESCQPLLISYYGRHDKIY